ncbi:flagellar basal-body MS-ring/collar protein FliF [Candidatus Paracaedibacter symbiosus]|uniref:flagellar basal-body MS-ring/collar protein FliF n=1 Tax=Candidatus Paracaedibacter symbiosus TaxID=244582 RepID=UPI000509D3C8|nr:flagellar basal-body MS-ring/collar protein FliF [Candidatus Paracaedibacter symbiosus]
MSGLLQILRGLGPIRLAAVGTVMLGILGFFIYLMSQTTGGNMTLLFSQIEPADGAKIVEKLESMGIPVQIKGDGTLIYVPADNVARARMDLAQDGLPSGGIVGYEIFDRNDLLSTSSSMLDINKLRALEGELAKSIKTISGVASARVHLVMPKRELFSRDKTDPTASIMLKMKGMTKLTSTQIQAIQHLVASAVPSLPADKISIIDDKGNLLAKGHEGEDGMQGLLMQQEAQSNYESKLAKSIEGLIEKTVGNGKVRVEVSSDMDFDQVTVNSEKYDPDGQVIRSTNNAEEDASSTEPANQNVSVQNALPQNQTQNGAGNQGTNTNKRNEENVSYEISRTVESHRKEIGGIKNLSVAVLVDGTYVKEANGKMTYTPRTKEELDQIKLLVQTAIGYKADRGDKIEIINMPFVKADMEEETPQQASNQWLGQMDTTKIIELAVLAAVGILILLMVVRPIILRVIENSGAAQGDTEVQALLASAQGQSMLPGLPDFTGNSNMMDPYANGEEEEDDVMISIQNVDGRVRASSLKKIGEIIDKHPEEAVTILRSWMYEEPWKQEKTI